MVSMVKPSRIVIDRAALISTPHAGMTVSLRGRNILAQHGPSFARAFVAGLRQGGDTAPLVRHF